MTTNQARLSINACEQQILDAHGELKNHARNVGLCAASSAFNTLLKKTLLPLLLCLVGLFCFAGPWLLGIGLIIIGIFISYNLYGPAKNAQKLIKDEQNKLNSAIDRNSSI